MVSGLGAGVTLRAKFVRVTASRVTTSRVTASRVTASRAAASRWLARRSALLFLAAPRVAHGRLPRRGGGEQQGGEAGEEEAQTRSGFFRREEARSERVGRMRDRRPSPIAIPEAMWECDVGQVSGLVAVSLAAFPGVLPSGFVARVLGRIPWRVRAGFSPASLSPRIGLSLPIPRLQLAGRALDAHVSDARDRATHPPGLRPDSLPDAAGRPAACQPAPLGRPTDRPQPPAGHAA